MNPPRVDGNPITRGPVAQAWDKGWHAQRDGVAFASMPYAWGARAYRSAWERGWKAAKEKAHA